MTMAWIGLPETVRRAHAGTGMPFRGLGAMVKRSDLRRVLLMDFVYWFAFAIFQTTFALFAARRFGFDAPQTGYFFAAFGLLGAFAQVALIRPIVNRFGDRSTFMLGLVCATTGLLAATLAHSISLFALALVPLALGIGFGHPTISSLVSRAARSHEQGRVQGAASAVESLGRTIGPLWGSASLQRFGEAMPYVSAAACLLMTLIISLGYHVTDSKSAIA
jgi:DHA1 family tetracycline resistance protein-like MFS transporter